LLAGLSRRVCRSARHVDAADLGDGEAIRYRIGLAGWRRLCVAGIWRPLQYPDGTERYAMAMAMITVNADEHPIMRHMHRPGDEKRSVVILRPDD